jgi:hypothetical protein
VQISLDSGQTVKLSPWHFIPLARASEADWEQAVVRGADEVRPGGRIWHRDAIGGMRPATVTATQTLAAVGAFNPLTLGGTIVVDGVVASSHSDWFLDGYVSADAQAAIYQAMFAPVRGIYALIGPDWMRRISQEWGLVDAVREGTPRIPTMAAGGGCFLLLIVGVAVMRRRRTVAA